MKKILNRTFSAMLALLMCVSLLELTAFADEAAGKPSHEHNQDGWECTVTYEYGECKIAEHTHSADDESCGWHFCTKEVHTHTEACRQVTTEVSRLDEEGNPVLDEDGNPVVDTVTETGEELTCGKEEHTHDASCCQIPEHTHSDSCEKPVIKTTWKCTKPAALTPSQDENGFPNGDAWAGFLEEYRQTTDQENWSTDQFNQEQSFIVGEDGLPVLDKNGHPIQTTVNTGNHLVDENDCANGNHCYENADPATFEQTFSNGLRVVLNGVRKCYYCGATVYSNINIIGKPSANPSETDSGEINTPQTVYLTVIHEYRHADGTVETSESGPTTYEVNAAYSTSASPKEGFQQTGTYGDPTSGTITHDTVVVYVYTEPKPDQPGDEDEKEATHYLTVIHQYYRVDGVQRSRTLEATVTEVDHRAYTYKYTGEAPETYETYTLAKQESNGGFKYTCVSGGDRDGVIAIDQDIVVNYSYERTVTDDSTQSSEPVNSDPVNSDPVNSEPVNSSPVEIDDPEVPLTEEPDLEIDEPEIPLDEEPEIELDDPDIPLADVPQTGDESLFWTFCAVTSGAGLLFLALMDQKRRSAEK